VLLHGLGTSSSTWVYLLPTLDPAWTVLALDLPGHGFSALKGEGRFFQFNELYTAIVTFIEQTVTLPFVLLGHSLGGWLAARYAAEHGETLQRLILVNNAGILHEGTIDQAHAFNLQSVQDLGMLLNTLWLRYPWYFKPFYPAVLHDLRARCVGEFVTSIRPEYFVNEDLKKLTMRVNIVWGTADRLFAMKSVEIMRAAIPGAQVDLIDNCGHVPQLEKPKDFTALIRTILREEAA
jgi:pyruvate dehydrogenase E2 component (dihydrolipoamide acetyltransferase)